MNDITLDYYIMTAKISSSYSIAYYMIKASCSYIYIYIYLTLKSC